MPLLQVVASILARQADRIATHLELAVDEIAKNEAGIRILSAHRIFRGDGGFDNCPSSNDLRRFGLWKTGVSGSVSGLI